ncbi:MAG TPA: LysM peptidoglycan-binding domain-containing protein, partial [Lacipirellulaceae bacterium]|nr:LysM peptidoglycan-binding domain-containing protein [Lacipirellulaceae bacterium]
LRAVPQVYAMTPPGAAIGRARADAAPGGPPREAPPTPRRAEATPPVGPSQHPAGRPIYAPLWDPEEDDLTAGPAIHVVHNGDTLERLAERYLGDRARALEIFDLNRDVLENPHLLPIGAELRLPAPEPVGR